MVGGRRRAASLEAAVKQSVMNPGQKMERDSLLLISCLLRSGHLHLLLRSAEAGAFISLKMQLGLWCGSSRQTSIRLLLGLYCLCWGWRRRVGAPAASRSAIRPSPSCPTGPGARSGFGKHQREEPGPSRPFPDCTPSPRCLLMLIGQVDGCEEASWQPGSLRGDPFRQEPRVERCRLHGRHTHTLHITQEVETNENQ